MAQHNIVGSDGEELAVAHPKKLGYTICQQNWRSGRYELDIVALSPDPEPMLVFVEVKTRTSTNFELPEQAVDERKIRRIVHAANHYIRLYECPQVPRFDVIGILLQHNAEPVIDHIEDAFYPPLG